MLPQVPETPAMAIIDNMAQRWDGYAFEAFSFPEYAPTKWGTVQELEAACRAVSNVFLCVWWDMYDKAKSRYLNKCLSCGGDKRRCDCEDLWLITAAEAPYY